MKRRNFLKISASGLGAAAASGSLALSSSANTEKLCAKDKIALDTAVQRPWLGPDFWANRLQDWQLNNNRIECLRGEQSFEGRSVALLTRELNNKPQEACIEARVSLLTPGKTGVAGFLLGVGAGKLDYAGAAMAQRFSGENGGLAALVDHEGRLSIDDFNNADKPLHYARLNRGPKASKALGELATRDLLLRCTIRPDSKGQQSTFTLELCACDPQSGEQLSSISQSQLPASALQGGLMLLSSPSAKAAGARWAFSDIATGGDKMSVHPERALGPVIGCMYSLNNDVLKLSAQFMPIAGEAEGSARLDYKIDGSTKWVEAQSADIGNGYCALFRLDKWNSKKAATYRIIYQGKSVFEGRIVSDPDNSKELNIALFSCITPSVNGLDKSHYTKIIPEETLYGRYTPENICNPHRATTAYCASHKPDLYVFCGDQYYEGSPTRFGRDTPDAKLDTLYRWYLWYWTFRDAVRNTPSVMLADDHDILQGNLWGNAGKNSDMPKEEDGGYKWNKDLVRMVYRMQHGHNPDAYDPKPIKYDIPVTFGNFIYGGINFALIEDRKFKTPPDYDGDPKSKTGVLLGQRQEAFLDAWADMEPGLPKILITASVWGSAQTGPDGKALLDYDANGYPADGRTRAVKLVKKAGALVLTGDQHLGMVCRQGVNSFDDGPVFFAGPAVQSIWQRWFEGAGKLPNKRNNDPNTGDFTDTFGNKMRVLAVANPPISHADYQDDNVVEWGKFLHDRSLKSEGYGIARIAADRQNYVLECWPHNANPQTDKQFAGWPYRGKFDTPAS
ncbi:alkaline phosphatase D family protein [Agaribacterium haliotis]|uniref:alkaline phosphatase D family protein n=1 Tax=Agaribacterium haliotis TaxID=2013869 RepID=UPI000BB556D0|nr:alkaline phosphatase D family protein [Agaribacterium haliotis]